MGKNRNHRRGRPVCLPALWAHTQVRSYFRDLPGLPLLRPPPVGFLESSSRISKIGIVSPTMANYLLMERWSPDLSAIGIVRIICPIGRICLDVFAN